MIKYAKTRFNARKNKKPQTLTRSPLLLSLNQLSISKIRANQMTQTTPMMAFNSVVLTRMLTSKKGLLARVKVERKAEGNLVMTIVMGVID